MSRGPGKWQRAVLEAAEAAIDPETGWSQWVSVAAVAHWFREQHLPEPQAPRGDNSRQHELSVACLHDCRREQHITGWRTWKTIEALTGEEHKTPIFLPDHMAVGRSDAVAIRRAIHVLAEAGRVDIGDPYAGGRGVLAFRWPAPDEQITYEIDHGIGIAERVCVAFQRRRAEKQHLAEGS